MARKSHGHAGCPRLGIKPSKTYEAWVSMKRKCCDSKLSNYPLYGGRGITYDPRWERFEEFLADMGEAPEGLSLDRKENDGNYCKENCRWATPTQQSNNKRNNRTLTFKGETLTMAQWAARIGISRQILRSRIDLYKWSIERALTTPAVVGSNQHRMKK